MQNTNTVTCPKCNHEFIADSESKEKKKRLSIPPPFRSQMYMNIIYLLIGALLALAGVSIPGCTDLEVVCPECDSAEYSTDDVETAKKDLKSQEDTATGNEPETDSGNGGGDSADNDKKGIDSATVEHKEGDTGTGTGIETDTGTGTGKTGLSAITDNCEEMKDFFTSCYWAESEIMVPTFTQMNQECSIGTISENLANWHACWALPENGCICPPGALNDAFNCQENKCKQWHVCMVECRL